VRRVIELKVDPNRFWRNPIRYWNAPWTVLTMLPRRVSRGPVLAHSTTVSQLPQIVSWPRDGGPFVTLPLVYTENVDQPGLMHSNLGMYRVQLSGGQYEPDREVGLHYQIHRGIGVHQAAAVRQDKPLRVNIFVGGAPAMILSARRIVQSIVDADTAPAKRESYKRFLDTQMSSDPSERATQLNDNPGLWLRLHPNVRSLVLPNVLTE